jgi:hypothetical protein
MMRPQVMVELPRLPSRPSTITIDQSWQGIKKEESSVEGHTTGSCLWDAAVVLADLLTIEPSVLLSLNGSYRELSGAAHQPIMRLPVPLLPAAVSSTIFRSCRLLRAACCLAETAIFRSWRWEDKCAVELGAGLGLPSAAMLALGAKRVVCTDGNKAMLGMVRRHFSRRALIL